MVGLFTNKIYITDRKSIHVKLLETLSIDFRINDVVEWEMIINTNTLKNKIYEVCGLRELMKS